MGAAVLLIVIITANRPLKRLTAEFAEFAEDTEKRRNR